MHSLPFNSRTNALAVLGLSGHPSRAQITAAYRRLAQATHPDAIGTGNEQAADQFSTINEAYHRLTDGDRAAVSEQTSAPNHHAVPQPGIFRPPEPKPTTGRAAAKTLRGHIPRDLSQLPIVAGPVVIIPPPDDADRTGPR